MLEGQDENSEVRKVITIAYFKQMLSSMRWEDRFGSINGILAIIQTRTAPSQIVDDFLWEYILKK